MTTIEVVTASIVEQPVGAIVNAANSSLLGGGGVDGAIHAAAGPDLLRACRQLNGCDTGAAKITPGFALPADYIIHTVGPIWRGGQRGEADLLASSYRQCLQISLAYGIKSMAFPCISTGIYRFPKALACAIAVQEVRDFTQRHQQLERILFCCFSAIDASLYQAQLQAS